MEVGPRGSYHGEKAKVSTEPCQRPQGRALGIWSGKKGTRLYIPKLTLAQD